MNTQTLSATATQHWLAVLVSIYLILMLLYGHRKGLIRMLSPLLSLLVSLILTKILTPAIAPVLRTNPSLRAWTQHWLGSLTQQREAAAEGANVFYQMLGLDQFRNYLADRLLDFVIGIAVFLLMFLLSIFIVKFLCKALDIFSRLPILNGMNRMAGAALGLLEALIYLWLLFMLLAILPENMLSRSVALQIQHSQLLQFVRDGNLLVMILRFFLPL